MKSGFYYKLRLLHFFLLNLNNIEFCAKYWNILINEDEFVMVNLTLKGINVFRFN